MAHPVSFPARSHASKASTGLRVPQLLFKLVGGVGLLAGGLLNLVGNAAREEALQIEAGAHAEARAAAFHGYPTLAEQHRLDPQLAALKVRSAAWAESARHLRLDRAAGTLSLVEDQFVLRSVPVTVGAAVPLGELCASCSSYQDQAPISAGTRRVVGRVGRGIFYQPGVIEELEAPWADGAPIPADLSGAVVLSDGVVIYSEGNSPWAEPAARAGTIAVSDRELFAIIAAMDEGMVVHVW